MSLSFFKKKQIYGFIQLETYENKRTWNLETITLIKELSNQLAIAISNAQLFRNAKQKTEEAKEINKQLVISNELNIKIQEAERHRIAQDLHDDIIQGLISLIRMTGDSSRDINLHDVNKQLNQMISEMRTICQNLRPSILDDLGLYSAVEWAA